MNKTDISRRKFLGRSGSLAMALPLASIPAAAQTVTIPDDPNGTSRRSDLAAEIPNRILPTRAIGPTTITVSGLPLDGQSDASAIIQSAIDSLGTDGGTVLIPRKNTGKNQCTYMLNTTANKQGSAYYALMLRSNVRLECQPGVKLQAMPITQDPIHTNRAYMVYALQVHDVELVNCWFVGERQNHVYSGIGTGTDEWCFGIQILGVTGMTIRGTQISQCTGDGIDLGNFGSSISSDIVICDVISTQNRRQALSITGGDGIFVYDSEFSYTNGTAPLDGIDIEPGGAGASNITIENCLIRGNTGCGIQLNAHWGDIINVNVKNCLFSNNFWNPFTTQMSKGKTISGGTLYGNAFFQNGKNVWLGNATTNYIVGGDHPNDERNNSFANNQTLSNPITYPNLTKTSTRGYVAGSDLGASADTRAPASGTTFGWNNYYKP